MRARTDSYLWYCEATALEGSFRSWNHQSPRLHQLGARWGGRIVAVGLFLLERSAALLSTPVEKWAALIEGEQDEPADWRTSVRESGYPVPALELSNQEARALWFDGYVRTYLERDLQVLSAVGDLVDFRRLMRAASHRLGGLVNQAEIARDTRIPRATVQRHLNLLETSFQTFRLPAYSVNRTKRLIKGPKLYWTDPALALWLSSTNELTGAHLENLVLVDLLVWREGQVPAPEVLYWRTTTDREVDFVIESGNRLLAIEVKAAAPRYADTTGLRLFREEYGDQFAGGLLLHGGNEILQMSEGILAAPWWRIL